MNVMLVCFLRKSAYDWYCLYDVYLHGHHYLLFHVRPNIVLLFFQHYRKLVARPWSIHGQRTRTSPIWNKTSLILMTSPLSAHHRSSLLIRRVGKQRFRIRLLLSSSIHFWLPEENKISQDTTCTESRGWIWGKGDAIYHHLKLKRKHSETNCYVLLWW